MKDSIWTRDELIAYILLFAAHTNFEESNMERNVIISRVDMQTFSEIHGEFDLDNDYQSLKKIQEGLERHDYTAEDIDGLLNDIKYMFHSDGEFDILERNMYLFLEKLLK